MAAISALESRRQQLGAVPAGDQRQAVLLQDRPELAGLCGGICGPARRRVKPGLACLGQALVERDEIAQPMQAVVGPADGVDAKLHGHVGSSGLEICRGVDEEAQRSSRRDVAST